jgi:hypothetical protein
MAAVLATPEKQAEAAAASGIMHQIAAATTASKPLTLTKQDRAVQQSIAPKSETAAKPPKPERVAMIDQSLLGNTTAKQLAQAAASEAKGRSKPQP